MLRFVPDSWLDGLARPLLLADPVAGLYAEIQAPDWRFAALVLLFALAALMHRSRSMLSGPQWRTLLGLAASFYVWTFTSGNGRYFFWGLLVVGPLVVVVATRLRATRAMRNTLILGVLALQGWLVWATFEPNTWALRPSSHGPGLAMEDTHLKRQPAVFITVGAISYSILVPQMHPQSRWTNLAGQQDLAQGMREFARYQELMASPLPKYAVVRATKLVMTDEGQPIEHAWAVIRRALRGYGLEPAKGACTFVRADIAALPYEVITKGTLDSGFWFCPVRRMTTMADGDDTQVHTPELNDVFAQIERRCPRMFPAGNAASRPADDGTSRLYSQSDTNVVVNHAGWVYFKHMRALNPNVLGKVEDVRAGRFVLDCERLPGRYIPPWVRHEP